MSIEAKHWTSLNEEGQISVFVPRSRTHKLLAISAVFLSLTVAAILVEGKLVTLPDVSRCEAGSERVGVIHVHTIASDGSGTVAEVMHAAQQANLSFIAITDHNVAMTESGLAEDPPDLPIISGEEFSTTAGHFIALGIPASWSQPKTKNDRELLAATRAVGAFRVLAHPFHPHSPWTDWNTTDFDGMEIWNEDATWRQNNPFDLMAALLLYPENDQLALVRLARTPEENFAKWDEISRQRRVAGICAADTHARIRLGPVQNWRFPGYLPSLRVAREHVLVSPDAGNGNPSLANASELVEALRNGHSFCGLDSLSPSDGFTFKVSSDTASGGPGDTLHWTAGAQISVSTPVASGVPLIKLFRDGREIDEQRARAIEEPISAPGRYRTEVFLRQPGVTGWGRWTLWVFTNPVYVTAQ